MALTLPAYFVGCASSRASILPGNSAGQLADSQKAHVLAVGDEATIVTIDGAEYRGQVVTVSNAAVVLGRTSNAGYEEHQIESQSIEHIAWTNAGSIWPYLVAIGAGAVLWSVDQLSHID